MSVTQRINWIQLKHLLLKTYVQLVATEAMCYSSWSILADGCALVNPSPRVTELQLPALYCAVPFIAACVDVSGTELLGPFTTLLS